MDDEIVDSNFKQRVYAVVADIPRGKVMSYGQIAAMVGSPRSARMVGGVAHWGDPKLPWQRVVMRDGGLASGYPGGIEGHQAALEAEGVEFIDGHVNMSKHLWRPIPKNQQSLL